MTQLLNAEQQDIEGPGGVLWTGLVNCTVARSTTQAHTGTHSLAVTATASGQMDVVLSTPWPTTSAGLTHTASIYIYETATSHFPTFYMRYGTTGNDFLQDFTSSPSETLNSWFFATVSGLSPATTTNVRIQVEWFSMAAGETIYIDTASLDDGVSALLPVFSKIGGRNHRVAPRRGSRYWVIPAQVPVPLPAPAFKPARRLQGHPIQELRRGKRWDTTPPQVPIPVWPPTLITSRHLAGNPYQELIRGKRKDIVPVQIPVPSRIPAITVGARVLRGMVLRRGKGLYFSPDQDIFHPVIRHTIPRLPQRPRPRITDLPQTQSTVVTPARPPVLIIGPRELRGWLRNRPGRFSTIPAQIPVPASVFPGISAFRRPIIIGYATRIRGKFNVVWWPQGTNPPPPPASTGIIFLIIDDDLAIALG